MANSTLTITFNDDATLNEVVAFDKQLIGGGSLTTQLEVFKTAVFQNYQVLIGTPTITPGEISASEFVIAFERDYNSASLGNLYIVTRISNVVTIVFKSDLYEFVVTATSTANVTFNAVNYTPPVVTFNITSYELVEATDPCNYVALSVLTDELAVKYRIDGVETVNAVNPAIINLIRGITHNIIELENAGGDIIQVPQSFYIDFLAPENISVEVYWADIGATVIVDVLNAPGGGLEYSLDNTTWQSENTFTGQPIGTHTMYVRDSYGCMKSVEYVVTETSGLSPFVYFSKQNSINLKIVEDVDNCSIFRNNENSLEFQGLNRFNYCQNNLFDLCDLTTIQFKSNYENNTITLREEDGTENNITVTQQTTNLQRFKKMDCIYYKYAQGKVGIYFENGFEYDEAGDVIQPYTLGGNLPDFAILGGYVTVDGLGTYKIIDVTYDESEKKRIIVIDYFLLTEEKVISIVSSTYNLLPFEVYEFTIDWSDYGNGLYDLVAYVQDDDKGEYYFQSENIEIATEHDNVLVIQSFNDNNRDIFYKFGIKHFIRMKYLSVSSNPKEDSEITINDNSSAVVKSSVNLAYEFEFEEQSESFMEQLAILLSCEYVSINGLGYIKDGDFSIEKIPFTNVYNFKASMLKSGANYNNLNTGEDQYSNIEENGLGEIPAIITDGTGFIKS